MSAEIPRYLPTKELDAFLDEILDTHLDDEARFNEQNARFSKLHEGDKGSLFWRLVWKIQSDKKYKSLKKRKKAA